MASIVKLGEGESIESGLKRFKRKTLKDGIVKELRGREAYVKPSVRKKLKTINAIKRDRKEKRNKKFVVKDKA